MRNVPLSVWFAVLLFWMGDAVAQSLARSQVTQGEVVELQWRAFREFSQLPRERGSAIDDAVRTLGVDCIFARILTVALPRFPRTVSLRWEVLLTGDEGIEARA